MKNQTRGFITGSIENKEPIDDRDKFQNGFTSDTIHNNKYQEEDFDPDKIYLCKTPEDCDYFIIKINKAIETIVSAGQSYTVADRSVFRAKLSELKDLLKLYENKKEELLNPKGNRCRRVIVRDF